MLYFEGEKHHSHRVVRAVKNRFGAVSELGVFEMTGKGLKRGAQSVAAVPRRAARERAGSAVLCCIEGSRPLLVEVQALVSTSSYGNARRMASGIDQNRLSLLLAVLEKRAGLNLLGEDVFINVAGGMTVDEPAADLAVVGGRRVEPAQPADPPGTAVFGEVGLAGEIAGPRRGAARSRGGADGIHALRRAPGQLRAGRSAGRLRARNRQDRQRGAGPADGLVIRVAAPLGAAERLCKVPYARCIDWLLVSSSHSSARSQVPRRSIRKR